MTNVRIMLVAVALCMVCRIAFGQPEVVEARQQMQQAQQNMANRLDGYGEDVRAVANKLADLGLYQEADAAVGQLLQNPESSLDTINGMMMRANYQGVLSGTRSKLSAYRELVRLFNTSADLRAGYATVYSDVYAITATLTMETGDYAKALAMFDSLLSTEPDNLSEQTRQTALQNKMTTAKLGSRNDKVIEAVDQLLTRWPTYGSENGVGIELRLERLKAADALAGDWNTRLQNTAYKHGLHAIFIDESLAVHPQYIEAGRHLVASCWARGEFAEALDYAARTLVILDQHRAGWIARNHIEYDTAWADGEELVLLAMLSRGSKYDRAWLELWALQRMMDRADVSAERRDELNNSFHALHGELVTLDISSPKNGLGVFDEGGTGRPELVTLLETSFANESLTPVTVVGSGPMRYLPQEDWTSGFQVLRSDDQMQSWVPTSAFFIRGSALPADLLNARTVRLGRAPGQRVKAGVYAVVPTSGVRLELGSAVPSAALPMVSWTPAGAGGPSSDTGVYYFRVASDCDANNANDFQQIRQGMQQQPMVQLDVNQNSWLDSCERNNPCRADFNGRGGVTVQDIFDFLSAWFAANPTADFNLSRDVTVQDIFDFLAGWFAASNTPC